LNKEQAKKIKVEKEDKNEKKDLRKKRKKEGNDCSFNLIPINSMLFHHPYKAPHVIPSYNKHLLIINPIIFIAILTIN
jgi:hypothetical protein